MLCFSQLQRQMFAPRGLVSSKLGKQNARRSFNKSLLPLRRQLHPVQTYQVWFVKWLIKSWIDWLNICKTFLSWRHQLCKRLCQTPVTPLTDHGNCDFEHVPKPAPSAWYYTCIGWGKATSKSLNFSWFRPAANGRLRKWSCYCCAWLQIITNRNGWHGCCQWQSHGIGATTVQRLAIFENVMQLALLREYKGYKLGLRHVLSLQRSVRHNHTNTKWSYSLGNSLTTQEPASNWKEVYILPCDMISDWVWESRFTVTLTTSVLCTSANSNPLASDKQTSSTNYIPL